jgi:hypothetical protein
MPTLRRLRQEDLELEASLGYKGRLCLRNNKTKTTKLPPGYVHKMYMNFKFSLGSYPQDILL